MSNNEFIFFRILKKILIAIQFLTILPVNFKKKIEPNYYWQSMSYYSFVGLLIGSILFCVYLFLIKFISPLLTSVIIAALWARITGALHLEAFVDAVDGFSAATEKKRILAVMKDPNCGSKGATALFFLIAIKIALLNDIPRHNILPCLLLVPAIGRWSIVCAASLCNYAREEGGLAKEYVKNAGIKEFLISIIILLIAGFIILKIKFLIIFIIPAAFTFILIFYLKKKIGGVTGDLLGALNEVIEVITLSTFLLI